AFGAYAVRRRFALLGRTSLGAPRLALLLLRDGHRVGSFLVSSVEVGQIGEQIGEHREPLIELGVAGTLPQVAVPATRRAELLAVRATERGERHLDPDHIADHLVGFELSVRTQWVGVGFLVGMAHEELMEVQPERLVELDEAPGTSQGPSTSDPARNEDALDDRLKEEIA